MDSSPYKKLAVWLILAVVIVLGVVAYSAYLASSRKGKIAVEVLVVPKDAAIQANGVSLKNGTTYLEAGTYTVVVSKEGFQEEKSVVHIDESNRAIQVGLAPVSVEAQNWAQAHEQEYMRFEQKVGIASRESGESFAEKHPITKLLPEQNLVYQIGYLRNEDDTISLTIHATTPEQRKAALQHIRDWGYDPIQYNIVFSDFKNPLE